MATNTSLSSLSEESKILSELLRKHHGRIVVYTGAGISTSAAIPDYRGTNGLYRNSKPSKRKMNVTKLRLPEASFARPTFTHMAINVLVSHGYVRHVVSQNVDCLHLRSGLPPQHLSELHGNLFIEQCLSCKRLTYRAFDVGENTSKGKHLTGRICPFCCDGPTALSLQRSIAMEAVRSLIKKKKKASAEDCVIAIQRAAQDVEREFDQREGKPAPMLHDVIVHYGERLALDNSVNRVPTAIEAIRGTTYEELSTSPASQPSDHPPATVADAHTPSSPLSNPISTADSNEKSVGDAIKDTSTDRSPVSLILVIGTSLTVLRFYSFLWPRGLARCLTSNTKNGTDRSSSPRTSKRIKLDSDAETESATSTAPSDCIENCELAIINMQSTCKDGLACFVSRHACDELLRETVEGRLGLSVPVYDMSRDPLRELFIPLSPEEEITRTRPNIFQL